MKRYKLIKKGKRLCTVASAVLFTAMGLAILPNNVKADVETTNQVQVSAQQESNIKATSLNTDSQSNNNSPVVQQNNKELKVINSQSSTIQNGWQQSDNNTYYYQNGQKLTGQQTLNGKDYYFNSQGQQQKNYFLTQNNHTYYYQADGTRLNDGFYNNWGHTYYFQKDGSRLDNGFYNNWGHTYYFGEGGVRLDDGFYNNWSHTYYFQKDGSRLDNGFYNNWGRTYYFGEGGVRLDDGFYNNWGRTYYFQKDGSRLDSSFYNNWGRTYYFGADGARWDNRWMNAWGKNYYFKGDGSRATSEYFTVNGKTYYFDDEGIAHNGSLVDQWKSIISRYNGHRVMIAVQSQKDGWIREYTNTPGLRLPTASTVKVAVLAQLLHNTNGNLTSYQQSLAAKMIQHSDNAATTAIVNNYLGGVNGMQAIYNALGMTQTTPGVNNHWGLTQTTAVDQLKLLNEIFIKPQSFYLNDKSRSYIKSLMATVAADQRWGISAGSSQFYLKNGWLPLSPSWNWYVNSIGFIPQGDHGYSITVYTGDNISMNVGVNLVESLARVTKDYL